MRRGCSAAGAILLRGFVPIMNNKAADIGNPGEGVSKNKNGIPLPNTVGEQQNGTDETEPPERRGYHDLFAALGRNPLHEKPRKENEVTSPSKHLPEMPLDAQELLVPKQ